jgi:hypothetical protein
MRHRPYAKLCYLISSVRFAVEDLGGTELSVTVNVSVPFGKLVVGVPLMVTVSAASVRPVGNAGVTDHLRGVVAPVVARIVGG